MDTASHDGRPVIVQRMVPACIRLPHLQGSIFRSTLPFVHLAWTAFWLFFFLPVHRARNAERVSITQSTNRPPFAAAVIFSKSTQQESHPGLRLALLVSDSSFLTFPRPLACGPATGRERGQAESRGRRPGPSEWCAPPPCSWRRG
jgi:hypothetical protein